MHFCISLCNCLRRCAYIRDDYNMTILRFDSQRDQVCPTIFFENFSKICYRFLNIWLRCRQYYLKILPLFVLFCKQLRRESRWLVYLCFILSPLEPFLIVWNLTRVSFINLYSSYHSFYISIFVLINIHKLTLINHQYLDQTQLFLFNSSCPKTFFCLFI